MRCRCIVILGLVLFATLAGCDDRKPSNPNVVSKRPLRVVASAACLADLVRQIGQEQVQVVGLVENGDLIRDPILTPEDHDRIRTAEALVFGGSIDSWITAEITAQRSLQVVRADRTAEPYLAGTAVWLDPRIGEALIAGITERLSSARPSRQGRFTQNSAKVLNELRELMRRFPAGSFDGIRAVTTDELFLPLFKYAGARVENANVRATGTSEQEIQEIRRLATARRARTLFVPADTPQGARDYLANRTGLRVRALDALGTTDRLGNDSYLRMLTSNFEQLRAAIDDVPVGE